MKIKILSSVIVAAIFSGCASVKIQSWVDPAFKEYRVGKTMVLGVGESKGLSIQYETMFVERLQAAGLEAASLHVLLPHTDQISREKLVEGLKQHGYENIIVTRLLSKSEQQKLVRTGVYPAHYRSYWGYYNNAHTTSYIEHFTEIDLETNLYDVKTEKMVWSGRNTVYDHQSEKANMKGIINAVVKDLGKKGLL